MFDVNDITKGVAEGNFLLLAKTISQIENKVEGADAYLAELAPKAIPIIPDSKLVNNIMCTLL